MENARKENSITGLHIGNAIRDELKRQERSNAWLAQKIHMDPSNLSKLLRQSNMNTEILWSVSNALHCNFFELYSQSWEQKNTFRKTQ
jgi:hypothetical protein